jgi:riboflavin kinase/FMN adenylyltransferase
MHVVPGIDALEPAHGPLFVVVGVFDGLHRGHLYLLDALDRAAAAAGANAAVVTFDHHPDEIVVGSAPPLLCDPQERLERLAGAGVDVTVVQHFDVALRTTPYDAFIRRIAERTALAGFLMTPDSSFGYERGGTPQTVAALGREMDYEVVVVPPFELDGRPVRSSDIRTAISAGDLMTAERLLGRPMTLTGRIEAGSDGRTARLRFDLPIALPPRGSYAARIRHDETWREGRATIDDRGLRIEPAPAASHSARVFVELRSARG